MEINKEFKSYCRKNNLQVRKLDSNVYETDNFGKFLLLQTKTKYGKEVIIKDGILLLNDKEIEALEDESISFVVFIFGKNFYYTKVEVNEEGNLNVKFNPFIYIGEYKFKEDSLTFPHLGIHDDYESLNGTNIAKNWVKKAKFLGDKTLATITKNTLSGTLPFQMECQKNGIKYIVGETISVCYDFQKQKKEYIEDFPADNEYIDFRPECQELILFVKNEKGWRNLLKINYSINVLNIPGEGNGDSSFIKWTELKDLSEGLILVFNNFSILETNFRDKDFLGFERNIKIHKKYFEDCYFQFDSVRYYDKETDRRFLNYKKYFLENHFKKELEVVTFDDCYFLEKEHSVVRKVVNEVDRKAILRSEETYMKSLNTYKDSLEVLFVKKPKLLNKILKEGLKSLNYIESNCNFNIETGIAHLPNFYTGKIISNKEYLKKVANKGLIKLEGRDKERYKLCKERLDLELDLILEANLEDYFLIQKDTTDGARSKGIIVGTGRGSVVGSILAYALEITTVNPLDYQLLFERFLNRTRILPPKEIHLTLENGENKVYREDEIIKTKRGEIRAIELTAEDEII